MKRYAIYYAPDPDSALWHFGSAVIGYDAATGAPVEPIVPDGLDVAGWQAATADPRKYGFHATLKAPFPLAHGQDEDALIAALGAFCAHHAPVELGACPVSATQETDGFIAFHPADPPPELGALERAIVTAFEPFRAPLSPADRARRDPERLTARQRDHLDRYGYPYVFEDFRLHMTLSGRLPQPRPIADWLERAARARGVPLGLRLDRLALFHQPDAASRFEIMVAAPLTGA